MGKKILIIDDNEQDRKIITRFLNKAGYDDVITAELGEAGIEAAVKEKPDVIITDTVMPDIDGFEVCRRVREAKLNPEPKIIVITGTIDAVDAVEAKKAGADDYCAKTSAPVQLVETVKQFI